MSNARGTSTTPQKTLHKPHHSVNTLPRRRRTLPSHRPRPTFPTTMAAPDAAPRLSTSTASTAIDPSVSRQGSDKFKPHEPLLSPKFEQGPEQDERELEECGGDEPRDPPGSSGSTARTAGAETDSEKEDEANKVHWDDGEMANPRNWSTPRRWFLTIITSLVLVNV